MYQHFMGNIGYFSILAIPWIKQYVEDNRCKVCLDNEAVYILLPCAHLGYCLECVSKILHCAICRKPHSYIVKVYKS